ncbi:hypothetical protein FDECE_12125 [Fusarium decemcellulare]|nr:hypothetical protein FDECE_12125 [Fusarium decemcellulare]
MEKSRSAFVAESVSGPSNAPPTFQESFQDTPLGFKSRFACIAFARPDRIRLINFTEVEIGAIYEVVKAHWPQGINNVRPFTESREIKLNGYPWSYDTNGNDDVRRLTLRIIEHLYNIGWVLQASVDVTKNTSSRDSLVFRKQDPIPPPCEWISISFDRGDKLKILGELPKDLADAIITTFITDIQKHEAEPARLKIKFKGWPWHPNDGDMVATNLKILTLLETLERYGFTLYATTSARYGDDWSEANVLICQKQLDWTPGAPIWHR